MNCKFMEIQWARKKRLAFWVTNWKQGNTRELSARVPSKTVNLYTVLGHLISSEMWHTFPSPSYSPCSFPLISVIWCALTIGNLTELLTVVIPQWSNNFKISDNEGNIKKDCTVAWIGKYTVMTSKITDEYIILQHRHPKTNKCKN